MSNPPEPTVMPLDREIWRTQLNLSNFINCYYQYRDVISLNQCQNVLLVGPGQGLEVQVLRARGFRVTTLDIDPLFEPDIQGSVHSMPMFSSGQFDVVIASHVLEHLPVAYLDPALSEIARVGKHAIVYLPCAGRHIQASLFPQSKTSQISVILDIYNPLSKPREDTPRYRSGQHFWEVGLRGFRVAQLKTRFSRYFRVMSSYRNTHWNPSYNFVLKSNMCA